MENKNRGVIVLRPHQVEMSEVILKTFASKSRALISVAMGCGRTITIAWTLNRLFEKAQISRALIVTPNCAVRDQTVQMLNQYTSKHARILRLNKDTKLELYNNCQTPIVVVSTLTMFRRAICLVPNFFDIAFFDDAQILSEADWNLANQMKSPLIAITPVHPFKVSPRLLLFFGKHAPDFSYGISAIRLKDLAEIKVGAPYISSQLLKEGVWKFVRPRDIQKNGTLKVNTFLSEDVAQKKTRSALRVGDIVLQNIFDFGKMAMVRDEDLPAIASQNLFIIRSKFIPPDILFEYLQSEAIAAAFRSQLGELAQGTVIKHISLRDVAEIPVPLPFSMDQIMEFGTIKRFENIEDLKKARNELVHLREAYKQFSEGKE